MRKSERVAERQRDKSTEEHRGKYNKSQNYKDRQMDR